MIDAVKSFFTDTDWAAVGRNIITGLGSGIGAMTEWLKGVARSIASAALEAIKGFFGIKSPSVVMAGVGKNLSLGLAKGITEGGTAPVMAARTVAGRVASTVNQSFNLTINAAGGVVDPRLSFGIMKALAGV